MSNQVFSTLDELRAEFPRLKRGKQLHPIAEKRLAELLQSIYPNAYPKSEPGEMPGGRADLAFYFQDGRYVIFEVFATVSQVAQDLRHLEQSNAQARIAILTDPFLDNGAIYDEYFAKRPRDPFPHLKLSEILVAKNESIAQEKLKRCIDDAFNQEGLERESVRDIHARLEQLALGDVNEGGFGENRFTTNLASRNSCCVAFAAVPLNKVVYPSTSILKIAKDMLQAENWYNADSRDHPPRYWPPTIFEVPTSRRSDQDALLWEDVIHPDKSILSRLAITGLGEVFFASSTMFVTTLRDIAIFQLGPILAECWKFAGLVAQLYRDIGYRGKTHLCIVMCGTEDSHLGCFADGWCEPFDSMYWADVMSLRYDWSCHSPNLKSCEEVDLMNMEAKKQPDFIGQLAEAISLAYNHDTPRCFDKTTGLLPRKYFA